jgi:hypothetical protein
MKSPHSRLAVCLAVLISSLVAACGQPSAPASLEDTPENRSAQIERYFASTPPEALVKDMLSKMTARMPDDKRTVFVERITAHLDMPKMRTIMHDAMSKNFTADELRALADFYGSALGKSVMAKFGTYMQEAMPQIQQEFIAAAGKAQAETAEKAAEQPAAPEPAMTAPEPPKG